MLELEVRTTGSKVIVSVKDDPNAKPRLQELTKPQAEQLAELLKIAANATAFSFSLKM